MTDYVRISSLSKTGDHQARIAVLSGIGGVDVYDIRLEHPDRPRPVRRGEGAFPAYRKERMMAERNEPTKEQVEAAAGFLRDNLHLFGPQACFLETGHIDEIALGMLRAAGKAAH